MQLAGLRTTCSTAARLQEYPMMINRLRTLGCGVCWFGGTTTVVQCLTRMKAAPAADSAAAAAAPGSHVMNTDSSTVKLNMSRTGPCRIGTKVTTAVW